MAGATPRDLSDALAEMKAVKVSANAGPVPVLGSDSIVALADGTLLDKPESREEAAEHLARMSGGSHELWSAAVIAEHGRPVWRHVERAKLHVRPLSGAFIDRYLDQEWPAISGCVGCFRIEGRGCSSSRGSRAATSPFSDAAASRAGLFARTRLDARLMALPYAEVIGDPIAHSKSPKIHGFWLEALGIEAAYRATHVTPDALPAYFAARKPIRTGAAATSPCRTRSPRWIMSRIGRMCGPRSGRPTPPFAPRTARWSAPTPTRRVLPRRSKPSIWRASR